MHGLNSLPVAGINSQAASDLVLKGSTDTVTTTVAQVRRADGTHAQLLLKNGVKLAEGTDFFYSKNSEGDLTSIVVPRHFSWNSQYWCDGWESCGYHAWRTYSYYKYTYSAPGGPGQNPKFGISIDDTVPKASFYCSDSWNRDVCTVEGLVGPPLDPSEKAHSVSGRSYEGGRYSPQIKLVDGLPMPQPIEEDVRVKEGNFPITQATQINRVESVSGYSPRREDNVLYRSQVQKFMESMCSDPDYGQRLVGCIPPAPTDSDGDGQAGKVPLILVPGIGGSKLEYAEDVPRYDSTGNLLRYEHRAGDQKWPALKTQP